MTGSDTRDTWDTLHQSINIGNERSSDNSVYDESQSLYALLWDHIKRAYKPLLDEYDRHRNRIWFLGVLGALVSSAYNIYFASSINSNEHCNAYVAGLYCCGVLQCVCAIVSLLAVVSAWSKKHDEPNLYIAKQIVHSYWLSLFSLISVCNIFVCMHQSCGDNHCSIFKLVTNWFLSVFHCVLYLISLWASIRTDLVGNYDKLVKVLFMGVLWMSVIVIVCMSV